MAENLKDPFNYIKFGIRGQKQVAFGNWDEYKKYKTLGRNDKCACDSGRKYKKCCINRNWETYQEVV